mgnify:CR=1 FL=1
MTNDRKTKGIVVNEYIDGFVRHPFGITVKIKIDKGDYWVMS